MKPDKTDSIMSLRKCLAAKKKPILARWLSETMSICQQNTVSPDSPGDRFTQPIRYTINGTLETILNCIILDEMSDELLPAIEATCRILAVQEIPPSRAIGFMFALKKISSEELADQIKKNNLVPDYMDICSKIDSLVLIGLDLYLKCKNKILEMSFKEMTNRKIGYRDTALSQGIG